VGARTALNAYQPGYGAAVDFAQGAKCYYDGDTSGALKHTAVGARTTLNAYQPGFEAAVDFAQAGKCLYDGDTSGALENTVVGARTTLNAYNPRYVVVVDVAREELDGWLTKKRNGKHKGTRKKAQRETRF